MEDNNSNLKINSLKISHISKMNFIRSIEITMHDVSIFLYIFLYNIYLKISLMPICFPTYRIPYQKGSTPKGKKWLPGPANHFL